MFVNAETAGQVVYFEKSDPSSAPGALQHRQHADCWVCCCSASQAQASYTWLASRQGFNWRIFVPVTTVCGQWMIP